MQLKFITKKQHTRLQSRDLDGIIGENAVGRNGFRVQSRVHGGLCGESWTETSRLGKKERTCHNCEDDEGGSSIQCSDWQATPGSNRWF